jgi:Ca-activated chloride channel homolog
VESIEEGERGESMRTLVCLVVCCFSVGVTVGQSVRSLVREGNGQYKDQKYSDAEVSYRKALEKEQDLVPGHFNLGNSLYKQDKADEAIKAYESALMKAESKETKAESYYNMGNAFMKGQRYQDALKSYIESLKLKPDDQDTKYNLSYALAKMREQQQQQNKNDKNKDDKQDQKKDQQNQDQQKKDQEKQDQQKQNQQQQKQDQQTQQQKQQQGQEKKMAKADAERILDVLKNSEKDVQKKLRVRQGVRAKTEKDW